MAIPIIMDCDPGIDDAFSLAMAIAAGEVLTAGGIDPLLVPIGTVARQHLAASRMRTHRLS